MGDKDIHKSVLRSYKQTLTCAGDWHKHCWHKPMATMHFEVGNEVVIDFNEEFEIPSDCPFHLEQLVEQK